MNNETTENQRNIKLNRMKHKIFFLEKNNLTTNKKTDSQMKDEIIKIIMKEAKKCY